jgi:hypothetical protein
MLAENAANRRNTITSIIPKCPVLYLFFSFGIFILLSIPPKSRHKHKLIQSS